MSQTVSARQYGAIAADFLAVATLAGLAIGPGDIEVQHLDQPHQPPSSLPVGMSAVYVFLMGEQCLKVGKAGPKSAARFTSHHYGLNAPSTLAKSLIKCETDPRFSSIDAESVKGWICANTSRVNFLLPSRHGVFALALLEAFVQCRLRPEFEGFAAQRIKIPPV